MRTALCMSNDGLVGRTYLEGFLRHKMKPNAVLLLGDQPEPLNELYYERTRGRWNPPSLKSLMHDLDLSAHFIKKLNDETTVDLIQRLDLDIVIQGNIGIIKEILLKAPKLGFLNIHPGSLPEYRGCSAPEWAIYNNDPVYATAHLIDSGIDTGPIICMDKMDIKPSWDYFDFRSNVYLHCANVMIKALRIISSAGENISKILTYQDPESGSCKPPMTDPEKIKTVHVFFKNNTQK